jgi:cysteine desulfurase / selenocysteine lyase
VSRESWYSGTIRYLEDKELNSSPLKSYRERFVGLDVAIPQLNGASTLYTNFDNAASTPALQSVRDGVNQFLDYYSSVHRGTGFKSQLSTWAFEQAREKVLRFVGADPSVHVCIFGKNTTEATNKLARRLPFQQKDVILSTVMEHHSDDLPFRAVGKVVHVGVLADGRLDEDDFDRKLDEYRGRVRLVAISGASNVTGFINPIHRLARKAHAAGALILADCAQYAPHRSINMGALDDPEHLDFVAISAHKMYAPYGTGALIGPRSIFEQGPPDLRGGGTVEIVTEDDVTWSAPPDRDEAGSPNVVGAVALGLAIDELEQIGMQNVADHEAELTTYALKKLAEIKDVQIFGDPDPANSAERLGVIPFLMKSQSHFLVSSILGYEFGIGVRSGCFCAHPYIMSLLHLTPDETAAVRSTILSGDRSEMPGMIRISFGLYNTLEEVDRLMAALIKISRNEYQGRYRQEIASGEFTPEGWEPNYENFF